MSIDVDSPSALRALVRTRTPQSRATRVEPGFGASLERLLDVTGEDGPAVEPAAPPSTQPVRLSRHAESRLASRGIPFGPAERSALEAAVDTLDERGAQKALVVTGQDAWIVGVPKRTVITVMSREEALGQVFTDLDATYLTG